MVSLLWDNLFKKAEEQKDPAHILKENFLFQDLTKKELNFVREMVHQRFYRPGEAVFRQGEIGVGMYIVASGTVEVLVESHQMGSAERTSTFVTRLTPGDFFGELSLVEDGGRRSATALAGSEASLIGFFKPDLMEIIERRPSTGMKILLRLTQVLGKRLKETTDKVSELKQQMRQLTNS